MRSDQPLNSQALQLRFPEIYRDFFSRCSLVVSGTNLFYWAGESTNLYGGPSILQSIPLRIYVGIDPQGKGIKLGSSFNYLPSEHRFEETIPGEFSQSELLNFLQSEAVLPRDYTIHLLSELPLSDGPPSRGALMASLAVALMLSQSKVDVEDIQIWQSRPTRELIGDQSSRFDEVMRLAWKMETVHSLYNAPGGQSFANLVGASFPIVHIKNIDRDRKPGPSGPIAPELVEKSVYGGFRVRDAIVSPKSYWPLDVILVSSGFPRVTSALVRAAKDFEEELEGYQRTVSTLGKLTQPAMVFQLGERTPSFYQYYQGTLNGLAYDVLCRLIEIFEKGPSEQAVSALTAVVNSYHHGLFPLGFVLPKFQELIFRTRELLGQYAETSIAAKMTGSGGNILFVGPLGSLRQLPSRLPQLRRFFPEVSLIYASWRDGLAQEGVRVEQYLERGIYSPFVAKGSFKLIKYYQDSKETTMLSRDGMERLQPKLELLLDLGRRTISVRGKVLSSREIHSAKTTIAIFMAVLSSERRELRNAELPASSYTSDRNEFQSKIISPLERVLMKRLRKHLPLRLHGGITNFSIRLEKSNLPISVIEPIS